MTFDQPIYDFHLHFLNIFNAGAEGVEIVYRFDKPFTIVSGFESVNQARLNENLLDFRFRVGGSGREEGILRFDGPISSLTLDVGTINRINDEFISDIVGSRFHVAIAVPFGFNNGVVTVVGIALFAGLKGLEHLRKGRNRNKGG